MIRLHHSFALLAIPMAMLAAGAAAGAKTHQPRVHRAPGSPASSVAAANRAGTAEPTPPAFINASAVLPFVEGTIYHVYTAPERVTDIVLQPGEVLGSVASGDTVRWVIGDTSSGSGSDKRAHVLVKPYTIGLTTNLVITTDRRTYHITLSSVTGAAMSSVSWTYPQDALIAVKASEATATARMPIADGLDLEALHFNYSISGDQPSWRPLRAFDDGRQTFIEFRPTLAVDEAPPLFVLGVKGDAQLVNYRLRGHYYVVDRIFGVAELRLGTKRQEIVRITRIADGIERGRAKRGGK